MSPIDPNYEALRVACARCGRVLEPASFSTDPVTVTCLSCGKSTTALFFHRAAAIAASSRPSAADEPRFRVEMRVTNVVTGHQHSHVEDDLPLVDVTPAAGRIGGMLTHAFKQRGGG